MQKPCGFGHITPELLLNPYAVLDNRKAKRQEKELSGKQ